ncbi:MAG TPA: hypothetical protein VEA38_11220, partial [Terriglobales bacterium]|nr:hypothetical protein [Terriglobales bacterium]
RGGAARTVTLVLRGYPYTVGLSLTLILMTLFAPVIKVRDLLRRWTTQHVPVMVEPDDYPAVVDDVEAALRAGGIETQRGRPSWMLRFPTRLLGWFAGSAVGDLVAEELTRLHTSDGEILLHPSDMVVSGRAAAASRMRAIVAEHLTFTRAYLTWDKEANEIEDALRRVWDGLADSSGVDALARLRALEARMRHLTLPYEEWEVLFRQKLQVERAALRRVAGLEDRSGAAMAVESGGLRRTLEAVAAAVAEFRHSWKAERDGRGAGLVPFFAAAATLGAVMSVKRANQIGRRRADMPLPDAHAEARYPKAA